MIAEYQVAEQLSRQGHDDATIASIIAAGRGAWLDAAPGKRLEWRRAANGDWRRA